MPGAAKRLRRSPALSQPRIKETHDLMLNQKRYLEVAMAIRELTAKDRAANVRFLFDLLIAHLDWNTGVVPLNRDELAELMNIPPRRVTEAAAVLERLGAITRERVLLGRRSSNYVQYVLDPSLGWKGKLAARRAAKAQAAMAGNVVPLRQPA